MVVISPEFAKLVAVTNESKEKLCKLIVERESLVFHICKNLKIDYMLKVASLEYNLMKIQNEVLKNKRLLELYEQNKDNLENDREKIENKINKQIEIEFLEFKKIEKKQLEDIDIAIDLSMTNLLEKEEIEELNGAYLKLQRVLNPALKLKSKIQDDELFATVEKLYKKGNIKKIKRIAEEYIEEPVVDEIDNLEKLKNRYDILIKENQKVITKIKTSFPYNQKIMLEDENLYRRKKDTLNEKIFSVTEENENIKKELKKYLEN